MKNQNNIFAQLLIILFLLAFTAYAPKAWAQKKEISEAKASLKAQRDYDKVESSMEKLLKDSANHTNLKIWNLLYQAVDRQYAQINEQMYLKQKTDTSKFFTLSDRLFKVAMRMDSIDALLSADRKGKLMFRDKHAEQLAPLRPNLYKGGIFFTRKGDYSKAYTMFDAFIATSSAPLFNKKLKHRNDSLINDAAYWAVYSGYMMHNNKAALHHTYLALKDTVHYKFMLQYLAEIYNNENDTARYLSTLTEGFNKYPVFPYFFPHLFSYYSSRSQWNTCLDITNRALIYQPKDNFCRIAKSTVLLNMNKFDQSIAICDSLIKEDSTLYMAYYNAGLAYFNEAVALDKYSASSKSKLMYFYKKALPYLEKYKQMRPNDKDKWGLPLYTIYLNLNMGKQFDNIDKILNQNG